MAKNFRKLKFFFPRFGITQLFLGFSLPVTLIFFNACQTPPKIDLRKSAPADSKIYLEIDNVAETLNSLTASSSFKELAAEIPDFSSLERVQIAVVVSNFETSEKQISDENFVLNIKPQFVVIAETHAWSWQTLSLAENQLDKFVRKNYGESAIREVIERENGKFFTWTATDNRRFFAFVRDSKIYFGNDAAAIEKCLAVVKGEAESLFKNESLTGSYTENNLAFGYVSSEGVVQIADLAGVSAAVQTTEESGGRIFIAQILPQILRNTTKEIVWTANKTERGIEDNYKITLTAETASVVKETLAAAIQPTNSIDFLPSDFFSATRYNLKNPLTAWRSLLLLSAKNTDKLSGNLLIQFSDALLEPYGVSNAETFLSSIGSEVMTAQFDADGEKSVVIVTVLNSENLKKSVSKEINFQTPPIIQGNAEIWLSGDKQLAAAFIENKLILGERESVLKCLQARQNERGKLKNSMLEDFVSGNSTAITFARDTDSAEKIVSVLAKQKDGNRKLATFYLIETLFTEKGIERKTVSDFGLIGTILKQMEN